MYIIKKRKTKGVFMHFKKLGVGVSILTLSSILFLSGCGSASNDGDSSSSSSSSSSPTGSSRVVTTLTIGPEYTSQLGIDTSAPSTRSGLSARSAAPVDFSGKCTGELEYLDNAGDPQTIAITPSFQTLIKL